MVRSLCWAGVRLAPVGSVTACVTPAAGLTPTLVNAAVNVPLGWPAPIVAGPAIWVVTSAGCSTVTTPEYSEVIPPLTSVAVAVSTEPSATFIWPAPVPIGMVKVKRLVLSMPCRMPFTALGP